jgi:hypothetical protein
MFCIVIVYGVEYRILEIIPGKATGKKRKETSHTRRPTLASNINVRKTEIYPYPNL